jgi:hypothetical protein
MGRTLIYPVAGAVIGFLAAFAIVPMMAGESSARDTNAIILFVGTFLAGTGAIAGAIVGAVAYSMSKQQPKDVQ